MKNFNSGLRVSASVIALAAGAGMLGTSAHALTITGTQTGVVVNSPESDVIVDSAAVVTPNGILITAGVSGDIVNNGTVNTVFELEDAITLGGAIVSTQSVGDDFINTNVLSAITGSVATDTTSVVSVPSDSYTATVNAGTSAHGVSLQAVRG